jgi:hypothetical protein
MSIGNLKDYGNKANNFPWQLKVLQGLQAILDEVAEPLTCAEDSVTICSPANGLDVNLHDGSGTPITSTPDGLGNTGIDVNIIGGVSIEVNLDALDDQVGIYGYTDVNDPTSVKAIKVDSSGAVAIQDNGGSITVDGAVSITGEVEIINAVGSPIPVTIVAPVPVINVNLDAADDQVGVYGYINGVSTTPVPLNVNATGQVAIQDGGNSITVDAIDLDIRDLDCATDSVSICGSDGTTNVPILVDSFGAVAIQDNGNFISVDSGAIQKTQNVLRISGTAGALAPGFSAMSFASVGTANATVDSVILKPGETINIDAGGIDNVLGGLSYDTTNVGSELLIVTLI